MSYVILTFNKELLFDYKVYDVENYSFTPNLTVISIEKLAENQIKINTSTIMYNQSYTIIVSNIEAVRGDEITTDRWNIYTNINTSTSSWTFNRRN